MSNPTESSIISVNGLQMGTLSLDIVPHDEDNNEFDEIPDSPEELIGQPLNFRVEIYKCKDLPSNFCRGIQVEYTSFTDNIPYKTKLNEDKDITIEINENFEHYIEYLTRDDVDYLVKEKVKYKLIS